MKKKFLSILILIFCVQFVFTQEESDNEYAEDDEIESFEGLKDEKKKLDLSRFRVGGDFAVGFQGGFYAEVSPIIGYQIIEHRLEVGPGLKYQHQSRPNDFSINNVGGQAYIRGYLWEGLFLQVDGFFVNVNIQDKILNQKASYSYGNGFAGGGYAFNHKTAPFYLFISVKTNLVIDQVYPTRTILPNIGFQIKL